jgi:hypothetical protein
MTDQIITISKKRWGAENSIDQASKMLLWSNPPGRHWNKKNGPLPVSIVNDFTILTFTVALLYYKSNRFQR